MTTVIIPWRDTGHRSAACRLVCDTYRQILPGAPLLLSDSGHAVFNRAAARNHAARLLPSAEVMVVGDADTIPDPVPLRAAITAATDGRLHYPFTTCHYLTEPGTLRVLSGNQPDPTHIGFSIPGAQGGIMVMLAGSWNGVGGMDEAFTGWGYEDNAWHTTVTTALSPPVRHHGAVWHLWHPSDRDTWTTDRARNYARVTGHYGD